MKKIFLPAVLVLALTILGISSFQEAQASHGVLDCTTGALPLGFIYIVNASGYLYVVAESDAHACVVGKMVTSLSSGVGAGDHGSVISCQDVAIDHSDGGSPQALFCLASGNHLRTIARIPSNCAFAADSNTCEVLASPMIATLDDSVTGDIIQQVNALEIDGFGNNWAASVAGKFYNVNLVTGIMTERTDFGLSFGSSGDLVSDPFSPTDIFWTVARCPTSTGTFGQTVACTSASNDGLYKIVMAGGIATGGGPDSISFVTDLGKSNVFAADLAASNNICFVDDQGNLQERTRTGALVGAFKTTVDIITGGIVAAFGGTTNLIAGTFFMIDKPALLLAGIEQNAVWLILFMISGVAVLAFQFRSKSTT